MANLKYSCTLIDDQKTTGDIIENNILSLGLHHLFINSYTRCPSCREKFPEDDMSKVKVKRKANKGNKVIVRMCRKCLESYGAKHEGDKFEAVFIGNADFERSK